MRLISLTLGVGIVLVSCNGNVVLDKGRGGGGTLGAGGSLASGTSSSGPTCDLEANNCKCMDGRLVPCEPGFDSACTPVTNVYYVLPDGQCTQSCPVDSNSVNPSNYAGPCTADTECVSVAGLCGCCPLETVAASREAAFKAALATALSATPRVGAPSCSCPMGLAPRCVNGACSTGSSSSISSSSSSSGSTSSSSGWRIEDAGVGAVGACGCANGAVCVHDCGCTQTTLFCAVPMPGAPLPCTVQASGDCYTPCPPCLPPR